MGRRERLTEMKDSLGWRKMGEELSRTVGGVQSLRIDQRYRLAEGNQRKTLEPESEESREEKREREVSQTVVDSFD